MDGCLEFGLELLVRVRVRVRVGLGLHAYAQGLRVSSTYTESMLYTFLLLHLK